MLMLKDRVAVFLQNAWYRSATWLICLLPLAHLFTLIADKRRKSYHLGHKPSRKFPVPIIVVGNITVGGAGKTPFVISLAKALTSMGYRPGIITRGYAAKAPHYPFSVTAQSNPRHAGDEAVMMAQSLNCPIRVDPDRCAAVESILLDTDCNIIISDDGLQHYALQRDLEIVIVDGIRGLGNGLCLPAGPLREPPSRLQEVDYVVVNGCSNPTTENVFYMNLQPAKWINLVDKVAEKEVFTTTQRPFANRIHAVAGIGNPQRFFATLESLDCQVIQHIFSDHHCFVSDDIIFDDDLPVVMTEKDAVKCREFADSRHWYLTVEGQLEDSFLSAIKTKLLTIETALSELDNSLERTK